MHMIQGSLHKCEVMLKDVSDSKRLDAYVRLCPRSPILNHTRRNKRERECNMKAFDIAVECGVEWCGRACSRVCSRMEW